MYFFLLLGYCFKVCFFLNFVERGFFLKGYMIVYGGLKNCLSIIYIFFIILVKNKIWEVLLMVEGLVE